MGHPEIELRVPRLGWRGKADLVILSDSGCEILEFKTGEQSDKHRFQLRVYALLWYRDTELNPTARPADKLTLSYRSGNVNVDPPSSEELDALERELGERARAVATALDAHPPEARPSLETCPYCSVRHLCEDYWQATTQRRLAEEAPAREPFGDLEATIVDRHGPSSWDAIAQVSRVMATGKRLVLRTASQEPDLHAGDRVRVLDAHLVAAAEDEFQPALVTMGANSEVFVVLKGSGQLVA